MNPESNPESELLKDLDRCVKCGMCLQVCPTYNATLNEAESPRGRISLIQGLINNELGYSAAANAHLGNCLQCRACEDVCPSDVPYGKLIDHAMAMVDEHKTTQGLFSLAKKSGFDAIKSQKKLHRMMSLLALFKTPGINRLAGLFLSALNPVLARFFSSLPQINHFDMSRGFYKATNTHRGDVALFTGCIARSLDTQTLHACISVLNKLGYGVHVPGNQQCCGALHGHNGDPQSAIELAQQNIAVFQSRGVETIITSASGCASMLRDYKEPGAGEFTGKITDISAFLARVTWPDNIQATTCNKKVAVHDPCSLRRIWRQHAYPYEILNKIPGLDVRQLPGNEQCCGAAGSHMLSHADSAAGLRDKKLEQLDLDSTDMLLTSNIGCAMHFHQGLREKKSRIEVMHPIVLIDMQMVVSDRGS